MNTVRALTSDDIFLGMRLKAAANWNQTEADWRRMLALEPSGCFVGVCDGIDAATLTTTVFGRVAWIAMVLTDPEFRGRGLATTLMRHALDYLEARGVQSMRLDATALGKPVYEKFGFRVVSEETRFYGTANSLADSSDQWADDTLLWRDDIPAVAALDSAATGNDRRRLLELVLRDWPLATIGIHDRSQLAGFLLARQGSRATQLGPCIAADPKVGEQLLALAMARQQGASVYVDVPTANVPAVEFLLRSGLAGERTFFRMTRGEDVPEVESAIWANYGPEMG